MRKFLDFVMRPMINGFVAGLTIAFVLLGANYIGLI